MQMVKVSVITAVLNGCYHIEKALDSVYEQTYPAVEHVVIDGVSVDGTVDILKKCQDRLGFFISEPDSGIFNAMNKGVKASTGDIVFFLNADDRFCDPQVIDEIVAFFKRNPGLDIVYGNIVWDLSGEMFQEKQPSLITRELLARRTVFHQSVFAKREIFESIGGFSEHYKVVGDYEWMLRAFLKHRLKYAYYDRDIAVVSTSGVSNVTKWEKERVRAMKGYFNYYEILRYRIIPMKKNSTHRLLKKIFHTSTKYN